MNALRHLFRPALLLATVMAANCVAQVIEYESNGMKYQTATRRGLTVIVTHLPNHVAGFGLIQVAIANGSQIYWTVQPEGFTYLRSDGIASPAISADAVVDLLLGKASHSDVVKLVESYEMPTKFKAAATASAIALGQTRLQPGQSTDGAVFIALTHEMKTLTGGRIVFHCQGETFEFNPD